MKALEHLRTINHHKMLVMKQCFQVGLYKQGLLHDLSKYTPTEFLVGCKILSRAQEVLTMQSGRQPAIQRHGFIIKGGISITMSIGLITV